MSVLLVFTIANLMKRCMNGPGWFTCECVDGYKSVNNTCKGTNEIVMYVHI